MQINYIVDDNDMIEKGSKSVVSFVKAVGENSEH